MDFDARIGQRFDVQGVDAHWEPHADMEWVRRLARARGEEHEGPGLGTGGSAGSVNARIVNVSVSGAGVLAPAHPRSVVDTKVTITLAWEAAPAPGVALAPGTSFEAVIRRIQPSEEIGWAYYGVEYTSMSGPFMQWLDNFIECERADHGIH